MVSAFGTLKLNFRAIVYVPVIGVLVCTVNPPPRRLAVFPGAVHVQYGPSESEPNPVV
ncbi:unannotated protein [freshwater metagenome]|uniref:Unannotated protein n=1 Tax=freshwater metagenome TaxID=449393 RepID=A0A6J7J6E6_9ZZZZ